MPKLRRAYVLWIEPESVMALMGNWRFHDFIGLPYLEECADIKGRRFALPKDCTITGATYDWQRRAIGLYLEHPSFPEVPSGAHAPSLVYSCVTVHGMKIVDQPHGDECKPIIVEAV